MPRLLLCLVIALASFVSSEAAAQGKTCVYNCTPPPAPSGGGGGGGGVYYHPPTAPPAPSPAEIAAQQRRAAARRANEQGNAAFAKGDNETAIQLYQQAHHFAPNDPVILRNLNYATGAAALRRKDYSAALTYLNIALSYAPQDPGILRDIGVARAHQANESGNAASEKADHDAAVEAYKAALQHRPDDHVIRRNLEDALVAQKQARELAAYKAEQDKRDSIIKPSIAPLLDRLSAQFGSGGDFDGTTRQQPPVAASGGTASAGGRGAPLSFASGDLSAKPAPPPIDASVVDLRDKGTTVHPSTLNPPPPPGPQMPVVRATDDDLRLLFEPREKSLWPGPRNAQEPLINPLREPDRYLDFLVKRLSDGQTPEKRALIEKRIAETERAVVVKVIKDAEDTVRAAATKRVREIDRVLTEIMTTVGVSTRQELFDRRSLDPELDRTITRRTDPIYDEEQSVRAAASSEMVMKLGDLIPMEFGAAR